MSSLLNINSLHDEILEREAKRELIYEEVLIKVIDKIKFTNKKSSDCFLMYSCPNYIYGVPKYDLQPCVAYIMKKLTDKFFRVTYYAPNILFISWQHLPPKSTYNNHLAHTPSAQHSLLEYQDHKVDLENKKSKTYMFNEIDKEYLLNSTKYKGKVAKKKEEILYNNEHINYNPKPNYYNSKKKYYKQNTTSSTTKNNNVLGGYQVKKLSIDPNYIVNNEGIQKSGDNNINYNLSNNTTTLNQNKKKDTLDDILNELNNEYSGTLL